MSRKTSIHTPGEKGIYQRWRVLWERSPQRSPFSSVEYLESVTSAADLRMDIHLVESEEGDAAGAAVTWRRRGPYRQAIVPPFTPFSAVLLTNAPSEESVHDRISDLDVLLESIERHYHQSRVHLHVSLSDVRTPAWRGWAVHPLYTYVCSPAEDVSSEWSASAVRNLRTGRDQYEFVKDGSAAVASVNLCSAGYSRRGQELTLSEDRLLPLVQHMRQAGMASSYAVRSNESGEIDAAVTTLVDGTEAFYWIAGSRPGPGMTVLVGTMLADLAAEGIGRFDFMGANTASVAEFKRRLGGRLETYYGMTFSSRMELNILSALRRKGR